MASLRKLKDPKLKKLLKEKAAARQAVKRARSKLRRAIIARLKAREAIKTARKNLAAANAYLTKKVTALKKSDKQRTMFNKNQRAHYNYVSAFLKSRSVTKQKIFEELEKIPKEDQREITKIKAESTFMKYIKELPKRRALRYRVIIAIINKEFVLIRKYPQLVKLRDKYDATATFYPLTNLFPLLIEYKERIYGKRKTKGEKEKN